MKYLTKHYTQNSEPVVVCLKKRGSIQRIEMTDSIDDQIRSRFSFKRGSILYITNLLRDDLQRDTKRSQSVDTHCIYHFGHLCPLCILVRIGNQVALLSLQNIFIFLNKFCQYADV